MKNLHRHLWFTTIISAVIATIALLITTRLAQAQGGIIHVDRDALGPAHDGLSWTSAYTNVQDALAIAASGDEIWVAEGVYYPDEGTGQINDDRVSAFALKNGVALYGGFRGAETGFPGESTRTQRDWSTQVTVFSGDLDGNDTTTLDGVVTDTAHITGINAYHVVTAQSVTRTAVLDGFIITAGQANDHFLNNSGGGMYNDGATPTLTNVTFSGNWAFVGGGMCNDSSNPTLTNVTFSGNSASTGGGMCNTSSSNPTLTNVTFSGNSAFTGGGMHNSNSSPTLTDVTFSGNSATDSGGGVYTLSSNPTLTNVTFSGNRARYGGGMYILSSNPTLTNVTFSGNQAGLHGGGMYNDSSNPTLTNVTFSSNSAISAGGGVRNDSSNPTLTNCILWGNTAVSFEMAQIHNRSDAGSVVNYSLIQGGCPTLVTCSNLLTADPRFVRNPDPGDGDWTTPGDNDYGDLRLMDDSPAIDAGDNTAIPTDVHDLDGDGNTVEPLPYDLASNPRFAEHPRADSGNGTPPLVDMGAYETQALWIEKTASAALLNAGDPLTYTLTVGNDSTLIATDVVITDLLTHLHTVDFTVSGAQITPTGSVSYTWQVEDLSLNEAVTITITGVLSPSLLPGQTFANTAGFSSWVDGVLATGDDDATITQCSADLEIGQRDDLDPAVAGSPLIYTLVITNHGPTDSLGFVLTDTLPAGMTFILGYPGCHAAAGNTVTCNVPFIAQGATLAITTVVTAPPAAGPVTNTVTIDGTCPDLDSGNDVATETTYVSAGADLAVSKYGEPDLVLPGGLLTYTLVVTNHGPDPAGGVVLTDVLHARPVLLLHMDELSGATTFGDASGSGNHGTCTGGTCPTAGESGVSGSALRFDGVDDYVQVSDSTDLRPDSFTIAAWFQWDGVGTDNINFITAKGYENYELHTGGGAGTNGIRFIPAGYPASYVDAYNVIHTGWNHVAIVYTRDRALVYVDGNLVASKIGITGATDLSADASPFHIGRRSNGYPFDGLIDEVAIYDHALSPDQISVLYGKQPRYDLGTLEVGEVVTITLPVQVSLSQLETLTNTAYLSSYVPDSELLNNTATVTTTVEAADLAVTKVAVPNPAWKDEPITYTLTITNNGPMDVHTVLLTDTLQGALTWGAITPSQGHCGAESGGTFTCTLGSMNSKSLAQITLVVTSTAGGTLTNTARVTGDKLDPHWRNDTVIQITEVGEIDLALDKMVNATKFSEGNNIVYTVTLGNHGPITATGVIVGDVLPDGIEYGTDVATHGAYTYTTGAWDVGTLTAGEVATLTLTGTVGTGTAARVITNTAMLNTSSPADVFTHNNFASAVITVTGADLDLSKIVDNPMPSPRDTITYIIAVANHGPDATTSVVISDVLPNGITYATSSATQGSYTSTTGTWDVGPLAAGETVTLTLAATVDAGTFGQTITNTAIVSGSAQPDSITGNNADNVAITVNTPPIANDDSGSAYITDEDTPFTTGNVLSNDTDLEGAIVLFSFDVGATRGTVSDNGDGTFDYDPNGQFDYLAPGEQDVDTFTYVVADTAPFGNGRALTATATVTITITGINDAPTISNILNQRTDPDVTVGPIPFTVGDAETDAVSLTLDTISSNQGLLPDGNIVLVGSGANCTIVLVPAAGMTGTTTIIVTVSDGELTVYDTFVLAVGVNSPPEFSSTPVTAATVGVLYTYDVTVYDADPGDVLTITAPVSATWLYLTQITSYTATLSGTPVVEGDYPVELQASDGEADATQTFVIRVSTSAGGDEYYIYLPLILRNH